MPTSKAGARAGNQQSRSCQPGKPEHANQESQSCQPEEPEHANQEPRVGQQVQQRVGQQVQRCNRVSQARAARRRAVNSAKPGPNDNPHEAGSERYRPSSCGGRSDCSTYGTRPKLIHVLPNTFRGRPITLDLSFKISSRNTDSYAQDAS
jgi:hypothetical protein